MFLCRIGVNYSCNTFLISLIMWQEIVSLYYLDWLIDTILIDTLGFYLKDLEYNDGIQCTPCWSIYSSTPIKTTIPWPLFSPNNTQFLSGLILDFKGTKKLTSYIIPYQLMIFYTHKKRNTLKKITNNSLSKGEMFYRNISNFLLPLVSQRTASRSKRGRSQLDNKRL